MPVVIICEGISIVPLAVFYHAAWSHGSSLTCIITVFHGLCLLARMGVATCCVTILRDWKMFEGEFGAFRHLLSG